MRQTLNWFGPEEYLSLNTRMAEDQIDDRELTSISNFTFEELGGLKKINGNQVLAASTTVVNTSYPDDTTMVDCYWTGGSVYNNYLLLPDNIGIKFPDTFFSGLSNEITSASLRLYCDGMENFSGTMYINTADFTEASAAAPTYDAGSGVTVVASTAITAFDYSIPKSWITSMVSNNYGVQIINGGSSTGGFISSADIPAAYGDGSDGAITVTSGTVNIEDIYEDDTVAGVTTTRGVGKGLNNGSGTYDPEGDVYINATNFTIDSGATLTHGTAWGAGSENKYGVVMVRCIGKFENNGTVDLEGLGANGGAGGAAGGTGANGAAGVSSGTSGGGGGGGGKREDRAYYEAYAAGGGGAGSATVGTVGGYGSDGPAGTAGSAFGEEAIPVTTWKNLYGSGGGGGGESSSLTWGNYAGGAGGKGGGALRIYAAYFVNTGTISADGANGVNGYNSSDAHSGGGGGGSGGTIYIQCLATAVLGTDLISANYGLGGTGYNGPDPGQGGIGSVGRIYINGSYTGSTSNPPEGSS